MNQRIFLFLYRRNNHLSHSSTVQQHFCPGGTPHMKGVGTLVVSLRGIYKFQILVSLRVFWEKRHHI